MEKKKVDSHDSAYYRRNLQTTYGWYGSPGSSASLGRAGRPSRRYIERSAERQIPRPDSANYIYDGGLFTTPSSPRRDCFVIHPEWVSESSPTHVRVAREKKSRSGTWPGRRCRSAPPPSYRNPITWEPT